MLKNNLWVYFIFIFSLFIAIYLNLFVLFFCIILVLFEKCIIGRINVIPGVEFTTICTILVTLAYGWQVGVIFCIFFVTFLPLIINFYIGEKIPTVRQEIFSISFANFVDIFSVLMIHYLKNLELIYIVTIILIFKHLINNLKGKISDTNFVPDYAGIFLNLLFNLLLVFLLYPLWLYVLSL
ncbi:MAG: hypothetical protein B6U88_00225 [Candidatus Aenigmarchaeota archaeon ex4484_56]|nr:MAG: hypothetical protein B6U88_00225 [Candidatus Aenigmarchaeota archaeon ex4484_56]